jgi:hypothetical protein
MSKGYSGLKVFSAYVLFNARHLRALIKFGCAEEVQGLDACG